MDKVLMLKKLIEYYSDGKKADFAQKLGIKPQTISSWMARKTFDIELIYSKCENLDANWILTGEGDMLKDDAGQTIVGDNNIQLGNNNSISGANRISKLESQITTLKTQLQEKDALISTLHSQISAKDAQIDKLLSIIDNHKK